VPEKTEGWEIADSKLCGSVYRFFAVAFIMRTDIINGMKGGAMTILDTIKSRRSIRDFKEQDLPDEAIDALIEAIRWAPSAGNLQSRKFYFVFNPDIKKQLARAALNQNFVAKAPLTVVACADKKIANRYGDRGVNLYCIQDVAASVMNLMLTAHELGLGSVWVGAFNEFEVFEILDLPHNLRPVAIIPIGYPAKTAGPAPRIAKEEAVEFLK
jgi:nitroreductase